LNRFITYRSRC